MMNEARESGAALRSMAPMQWDGSAVNLGSYGSLTLCVVTGPDIPRTLQWSPVGGVDDNNWFDWSVSAKAGGAASASISARGVYNGQAGGFVRFKPGVGAGGSFYLSAGS